MNSSAPDLGTAITAAVPFVAHLGLRVTADPQHQRVELPDAPVLTNHVGTQHAGALFSAAETASGAAVLAMATARRLPVVPVVAEGSIRYRAPATGVVAASPELTEPDDLEDLLASQRRVSVDVAVELTDANGATVATASFRWALLPLAGGAA